MTIHFKNINNNLIDDNNLLKLNLHILALDYVKEKISRFTKVAMEDKNEEKQNTKLQISNSKEEKIKQRVLQKKKKNVLASA